MIIAEQHIDQVNTLIFAEYDRLKNFDNLPPARVRVMVCLPGADELNDKLLKVVLYVQQQGPDQLPWAEEGRLILSSKQAAGLHPFDKVFLAESDYNIRVDFFLTQVTPLELEQEEFLGYVTTALSDIVSAEEEIVDVELLNLDGERATGSNVQLSIDWFKFLHDKMVLEVQTRIEKRSGWPFTSARPFFVLYKWEPQYENWTPIYRSEVLTKGSAYPDSRGVMVFELAAFNVKKDLHGDHSRPLRLEFFHYKTKGNPKVLGYFETSLRHLRQSRKEASMKMELNTFAEGELVGELRMVKSKLTAGRSFFSLEAAFGGDVTGDFVYFDIGLTDVKPRKRWKKEPKPYYTIARYSDSEVWEKVYRSESATRIMGRMHRYKIAKLTEKRLNGGRVKRPISIMLFQNLGDRRVIIGHVETTVSALLGADPGAVLPLEGAGLGNGYVRVEQAEETDSRVYFGLHCVLERRIERSSSTDEGGEVSTG